MQRYVVLICLLAFELQCALAGEIIASAPLTDVASKADFEAAFAKCASPENALKILNASFDTTLVKNGRFEKVLELSAKLASQWPESAECVECHRLNARCYTQMAELKRFTAEWLQYADGCAALMSARALKNGESSENAKRQSDAEWQRVVRTEADSLLRLKDFAASNPLYEALIRRFPNSDASAAAQLKLAGAFENSGSPEEAGKIYSQLILNHPESPAALRARAALANAELSKGRLKEALEHWERYAKASHNDDERACAEFNKGSCCCAMGSAHFLEANRHFSNVLKQYPDSSYADAARTSIEQLKKQIFE